jgi:hypothetical protein
MRPRRPTSLPKHAVLLCVLSLALLASGCGGPASSGVRIVGFDPASGSYRAGDGAVSSLKLENAGPQERTFWVGHSVRDPVGRWHDAPAAPVTLGPGEVSGAQDRVWRVPESPSPPSGPHEVVMAVWSKDPRAEDAERLADARRKDAFRVVGLREGFGSLNEDLWATPAKKLGRGPLVPRNVRAEEGRLEIEMPAGTLEGGELESRGLYHYGSYRARIKVADAPSSITGFFLYKEPDFESEIDIEVYNDPTGRILFSTYAGGRQTNTVTKRLPFDPTAGFHEYRFDLRPGRADLYVDGELLHTFREGLPQEPMRLLVNSWYPTWLPGKKPKTNRYTYVDWIRH